MNTRRRTFAAGAIGAGVALGAAELVQGPNDMVPSLPVAVSQSVIELTPRGVATAGIAVVGKAATPILVAVVVVATLALGGLLAQLSRRSSATALIGALAPGVLGFAAAFFGPIVGPVQAGLTMLVALLLGVFTYRALNLVWVGPSGRKTGGRNQSVSCL